ncbi:hypothetical protein BGZ46_009559 [Entomortierella lignicola]|nr:hypothetical protein BGZ46_009559 [Entomortierella lignicola]
MAYIHIERSVGRYRRAAPPQPPATANIVEPTNGTSNIESPKQVEHILIVSGVALGSLLLVIALITFYVCKRRRRKSRRVGQLQEPFMDEKKTEEYYKKQTTKVSSAPTLIQPVNAHHRTRSLPIVSVNGVYKGRSNSCVVRSDIKNGADEQFQQISLGSTYDESDEEVALKRSLSTGLRDRSLTVTIPSPTLHHNVSLKSHGTYGYISRSPPIEEETTQNVSDTDPLPTTAHFRFGEEPCNSNRFSAGSNYPSYRRSSSSVIGFDPSEFKATGNMSETKRHPAHRDDESSDESDDDDTNSTASTESFDRMPAHQNNFETYNPYILDNDRHESDQTTHPALYTYSPPKIPSPVRTVEGIAFRSAAQPVPSRIMVPRTHGKQEMGPINDDDQD